MKRGLLLVWFLILVLGMALPGGDTRNGYEGLWKTVDDQTGKVRSIVRVERRGDELLGFIDRIIPEAGQPDDPVCEKGPKEFLGKPIKGMKFMWGFRFRGNELGDGQVFDPEQGKTYHCSLELIEGGRRMKLFGYIKLIFKVGRSQIWERLDND